MTQHIWRLANLETHIQQLLASVGLHSHGLATLKRIKGLQNPHTIDITLTVSCARNSDTDQTMEANPTPLPANPNSPSTSSKISNQNTSGHFLRICRSKDGWIVNFV